MSRVSKRIVFLLALVLVLFIIPSVFGADNQTDSLDAQYEDSNDIYFDSNAPDDNGLGTPDSPYKQLRDGRILDNSVIHLKNGVYNYSQLNSHKNVSFIGQDTHKTVINANGGMMVIDNHLTLCNVTFCGLNIFNQGDLVATNVEFVNSSAIKMGNYGDRYGGAIYCVDRMHNAYLTNCTFSNNDADYGGAIYLNGGILEINDCTFTNNTAYSYGGAIACESTGTPRIVIRKSRFANDKSLEDAGGALYIKGATLTATDLNITSCSATFGGAIALLKSVSNLSDVYLCNNTARYDGGAIYQIYGNLSLSDAVVLKNRAKYGGGLFIDNSTSLDLGNVSFSYNCAEVSAGAFYSLLNKNLHMDNVTYLNNVAGEYDDVYIQDNLSIIFTSSNYTLYHTENGDSALPSSYMSATTPVKDQLNGGNCWAFAVLGALESAILKTSGEIVDLSEENMKNLASLYSHYGWSMDTNHGGYDDMGVGYLVSWMGPVLESDEEYSALSTLSPVLESIMHVQEMTYLKRTGYYDLTSVKKAIRDYGGVYAAIYMAARYDSLSKKYVQCYRGSNPCDHAVVLVGWDDDFAMSGAPGKGAWIAKNSWGENWGSNGYFYVSYFDDSCLKLGENDDSFAFILNDTMKFDKNYQYDIAKTDYFFNTTSTVWYKNIFRATDDEYLSSVATYFEKDTSWELSVNVNNQSRLTKSGTSAPGYRTIDLGEMIPLNAGDEFEIVFKITVDGDAGVPISESISLNNYFYRENISYISYDGKNWRDLFKLEWKYPDHTYDSQVACIKAFTLLNPIKTTVTLDIVERSSDTAVIAAKVLNEWGIPVNAGNVTFKIGDETFTVRLVNGLALLSVELKSANITAQFSQTGYVSSNASKILTHPLINTFITLNVTGAYNPVNITANVFDEAGNPVKSGFVRFDVLWKNYLLEVVNGTAKLENVNVTAGVINVQAQFIDGFSYNSSNVTKTVEVSRIPSKITLDILTGPENNPVNVTAHVCDLNDNPLKSGKVIFNMAGKIYEVCVVNGTASIVHTFEKTGINTITAIFTDDYIYGSSSEEVSLTVSKIKVDPTFQNLVDESTSVMVVAIENSTVAFKVRIFINGTIHTYSSKDGYALFELKDLDYGSYDYTIELISDIYEADNIKGQFNITHHKTLITLPDVIYCNGNYTVNLKDKNGSAVSERDIYLTVLGKTYKSRTDSEGIAVFNLPLSTGFYKVTVSFIGDDEYIKSKTTNDLEVISSIDFLYSRFTYNSIYQAILYDAGGNLLTGEDVSVVLNGINYKVKSDNGRISLDIKLKPGIYDVKITNPSTGESKTQKITVLKRLDGNSNLVMYYGAGKSYTVRVFDDYGNVLKNAKVTFRINGRTYYRYCDSNGYASLKIGLAPKTYTVTAEYKGFKVSNKITVKTTLITKNIAVKKGKRITFNAKLINSKGKILKNKRVTFKFLSKTYHVKTNNRGIATFKILRNYPIGRYTIISSYGSLKVENKIIIKK